MLSDDQILARIREQGKAVRQEAGDDLNRHVRGGQEQDEAEASFVGLGGGMAVAVTVVEVALAGVSVRCRRLGFVRVLVAVVRMALAFIHLIRF